MLDAIGKPGFASLAAEVEVGLARMAHRPSADAVVEVEQAGLVGDLGAGLGRDQAARRGGRDRRLRVARALADEAARADRAILDRIAFLGGDPDGRWTGRRACRRRCGALRARAGAAPARVRRWRGGLGAGAGLGARLGAAAAAGAFFSFSSPRLTGEGRESRPRRCALPITALRLTPPRSSAIWLAVEPSAHIVFSRSIRSSVQLMKYTTPCVLRQARAVPIGDCRRERPDSLMG